MRWLRGQAPWLAAGLLLIVGVIMVISGSSAVPGRSVYDTLNLPSSAGSAYRSTLTLSFDSGLTLGLRQVIGLGLCGLALLVVAAVLGFRWGVHRGRQR